MQALLLTKSKITVGAVLILTAVGIGSCSAGPSDSKATPDTREKDVRDQIVATIDHPKAQVVTDNMTAAAADALMADTKARVNTNGFGKYEFVCKDGLTMNYRLFKPAATPGKKYPLVMFFHGSFNEGTDNDKPIMSTLVARWLALPEIQQKYPCYIVLPQQSEKLKGNKDWHSIVASGHKEVLDLLLKTYPGIDPKRIYITGHSAGGSMVYTDLATYPDTFAAGLACDGTGDVDNWPQLYVSHHVSLMTFVGGPKDPINPKRNGLVFEKNAAAVGGKFTCVSCPNLDHWEMGNLFLLEPGVVEWMFAQHR